MHDHQLIEDAATTPPSRGGRLLASWAELVRRFAWPIVLAAIGLSIGAYFYTVNNIGIHTDTADMLSPSLSWRQQYDAYKDAFPQTRDTLAIVIDGENADLVEDAAARLEDRLRRETALIRDVFYPQGDEFFARNGLLYLSQPDLDRFSDRLAEAQPLLTSLAADPSLRGLFELLGDAADQVREGGEEVSGLDTAVDSLSAAIEGRVEGRPASVSWSEMLRGGEDDSETARRIIVVQPHVDFDSLQPGAEAMTSVRRIAAELGIGPENGLRMRLTGSVALNTEELASVESGTSLSALLAFALVALIMTIGLRSWRLVVGVLVTLVVGLSWTAAFATATVGQLNMVSAAFAVLFIGLADDFGGHLALRYKEEVNRRGKAARALRAALSGTGGALTLSAVMAAATFLSFYPTPYRGVSELGLIAGAGMFIALFCYLTVLPAILAVLPLKPGRQIDERGWPVRFEEFIARNGRAICLCALVLGLACLPLFAAVRFDFDPMNLKDESTESVQTARDIATSDRTTPYNISILAPDLAAAEQLAARLDELSVVDRTVTLADYTPKDQESKLSTIDDMRLFMTPLFIGLEVEPAPSDAERRAAIASFRQKLKAAIDSGQGGALEPRLERLSDALDRYMAGPGASADGVRALESALVGTLPKRIDALRAAFGAERVSIETLPEDIRSRHIAADGRALVEVYPKGDMLDNAALRRFVEEVRTVAPDATDSPVVMLEAGDAVVGSFVQATVTSLVVVTILLFLVLRRAWNVALMLAPLTLAGVLTVAATVLLDLPFNFANIIVLPLLLGLGVSSGIYFVHRATQNPDVPLMQTSTPRAMVFSVLTTISSFGSMAISDHQGTASMGILLSIAISLTLLSSLIVLPAMMAWKDNGRWVGRGDPPAVDPSMRGA